nr:hypothetical protein Iba_chr07aCG7100 [Ipomoea batatas]
MDEFSESQQQKTWESTWESPHAWQIKKRKPLRILLTEYSQDMPDGR